MSVRLLGHPEVRRDGAAVALPSRNTLLLLARLAIEGTQSREALAALFWPDADEARGRTNLRRTIAYLREACGRDIDVLDTTTGTVTLTGAVSVDVSTAEAVMRSQPPDAALLQQAVALWDGDFLEGIEPEDEELESWIRRQRQRWQVLLSRAAEQLVTMLAATGRTADAWAVTDRWLARDPLSEAAHRERMRLELMRSDRAAALEGYEEYAQLLERELGVKPSRELADLAALARADADELAALRTANRPEAPMIGREAAHASLTRTFSGAERGDATLALVTGEAGIGKTRLLDEFLEWARPRAAELRSARAFPSAHRIPYGGLAAAFANELPRPGSRRAVSLPAVAESVARVVARGGSAGVFVLAIDDVHWLDPDSLELLISAAAAIRRERARLLLVATLLDDAVAASSQLADWLARMVRELRYEEIALAPLTESDTRELVRSWPDPLDSSAQSAAIAAAGRPLLIVETLRYLAAGGDTTTIAPAARESMRARLRGLSAPAASLAAAAAVLETEASLPLLTETAGIGARAAERGLAELVRAHVLVGDGHYAFCHELLRRTEYSVLPAEERADLHARAARALDA
ncbi:MAG: BTAD domain-containing putative transcriptional regulator, partial [Candidatus Dormibacteria bacterium]